MTSEGLGLAVLPPPSSLTSSFSAAPGAPTPPQMHFPRSLPHSRAANSSQVDAMTPDETGTFSYYFSCEFVWLGTLGCLTARSLDTL